MPISFLGIPHDRVLVLTDLCLNETIAESFLADQVPVPDLGIPPEDGVDISFKHQLLTIQGQIADDAQPWFRLRACIHFPNIRFLRPEPGQPSAVELSTRVHVYELFVDGARLADLANQTVLRMQQQLTAAAQLYPGPNLGGLILQQQLAALPPVLKVIQQTGPLALHHLEFESRIRRQLHHVISGHGHSVGYQQPATPSGWADAVELQWLDANGGSPYGVFLNAGHLASQNLEATAGATELFEVLDFVVRIAQGGPAETGNILAPINGFAALFAVGLDVAVRRVLARLIATPVLQGISAGLQAAVPWIPDLGPDPEGNVVLLTQPERALLDDNDRAPVRTMVRTLAEQLLSHGWADLLTPAATLATPESPAGFQLPEPRDAETAWQFAERAAGALVDGLLTTNLHAGFELTTLAPGEGDRPGVTALVVSYMSAYADLVALLKHDEPGSPLLDVFPEPAGAFDDLATTIPANSHIVSGTTKQTLLAVAFCRYLFAVNSQILRTRDLIVFPAAGLVTLMLTDTVWQQIQQLEADTLVRGQDFAPTGFNQGVASSVIKLSCSAKRLIMKVSKGGATCRGYMEDFWVRVPEEQTEIRFGHRIRLDIDEGWLGWAEVLWGVLDFLSFGTLGAVNAFLAAGTEFVVEDLFSYDLPPLFVPYWFELLAALEEVSVDLEFVTRWESHEGRVVLFRGLEPPKGFGSLEAAAGYGIQELDTAAAQVQAQMVGQFQELGIGAVFTGLETLDVRPAVPQGGAPDKWALILGSRFDVFAPQTVQVGLGTPAAGYVAPADVRHHSANIIAFLPAPAEDVPFFPPDGQVTLVSTWPPVGDMMLGDQFFRYDSDAQYQSGSACNLSLSGDSCRWEAKMVVPFDSHDIHMAEWSRLAHGQFTENNFAYAGDPYCGKTIQDRMGLFVPLWIRPNTALPWRTNSVDEAQARVDLVDARVVLIPQWWYLVGEYGVVLDDLGDMRETKAVPYNDGCDAKLDVWTENGTALTFFHGYAAWGVGDRPGGTMGRGALLLAPRWLDRMNPNGGSSAADLTGLCLSAAPPRHLPRSQAWLLTRNGNSAEPMKLELTPLRRFAMDVETGFFGMVDSVYGLHGPGYELSPSHLFMLINGMKVSRLLPGTPGLPCQNLGCFYNVPQQVWVFRQPPGDAFIVTGQWQYLGGMVQVGHTECMLLPSPPLLPDGVFDYRWFALIGAQRIPLPLSGELHDPWALDFPDPTGSGTNHVLHIEPLDAGTDHPYGSLRVSCPSGSDPFVVKFECAIVMAGAQSGDVLASAMEVVTFEGHRIVPIAWG